MPFFNFRNESFYYREKGKGTILFFIHGFLGDHSVWDRQFEDLSRKYKCIAIDLPGHGRSAGLGYVHEMELMADLVRCLLKEKRIRRINLIGHSMGGYVSLAYAEKYPDSIRSLVLVNSTAQADSVERKMKRAQLLQLVQHNNKTVLKSLVASLFYVEHSKRRFWLSKYLRVAQRMSAKNIAAAIRGMKDRKEREIVLKFAPFEVHYVVGYDDPILKVEELQLESKAVKASSFTILPEVGHMAMFEAPYYLNKLIAKRM